MSKFLILDKITDFKSCTTESIILNINSIQRIETSPEGSIIYLNSSSELLLVKNKFEELHRNLSTTGVLS